MSEASVKKYLQTAPIDELGGFLEVITKRLNSKKNTKEQIELAREIDEAWADYQNNGGKSIDEVFANAEKVFLNAKQAKV